MINSKPKPKIAVSVLGDNKIAIRVLDILDGTILDRVRNIPSRTYQARYRHWEVAIGDQNIEYIAQNFTQEEMECTDDAKLVLQYVTLRAKQATKKQDRRWEYVFGGTVPKIPYEPYTKGFDHQVVCLDAVHNSEFFGIFMEMGCGKSWVVVNEIRWAAQDRQIEGGGSYKVLITCPNGVTHTWLKEFKKHFPPGYDHEVWNMWLYPGAIDQLIAFSRSKAKVKIIVCGLDRAAVIKDALMKIEWDLMVIDESARIKNPSAKRTKAVMEIAQNSRRRFAMTGTPVVNNIMDLYPQFEYLSPGCLGFTSFYAFQNAHSAEERMRDGKPIRTFRNLDQLKEKMARYSFVVKKADCLDLPEKMYLTRTIEMSEKQRLLYNQMLEWLIASFSEVTNLGDTTQAAAAIAQITRLRQICGGFIKNAEGAEKEIPCATGKMDQLVDDLEEIEGKVIIWRSLRYDEVWIKRALAKTGRKFVEYTGSTPEKLRPINEDAFNNDESVTALIADPGCAGEGKTLLGTQTMRCATSIFWSNDFSLGKRLQAEDRNHRIGQDREVTYIDYAMEDSIEEQIADALQAKKDLAALMTDVKGIKDLLIGGLRL